jgi:hypothetical protein
VIVTDNSLVEEVYVRLRTEGGCAATGLIIRTGITSSKITRYTGYFSLTVLRRTVIFAPESFGFL